MRLENIWLALLQKEKFNMWHGQSKNRCLLYSINHKTVCVLTGLDGIGVTPEDFLLGWSLDRLSEDSFWLTPDPTCFVIASLVVNLLFPFTFFPFDFFAKKSSNDLSLSDISSLHEKDPGKAPGEGNCNRNSRN